MPTAFLFSLCVLIWGTTWYAITAQLAVLSPVAGVALRFCLAAAVLMAFCGLRGERMRHDLRTHAAFALQGLTGFCLSYVGVYEAERHIVSGVVAVGYAASPLVGLVMARAFLGTPMSRRVAAGGAIGLAGVALIFAHEFARLRGAPGVAAGAAFTAGAVFLSSVSTIAAARYQRRGVHGWVPLAWAMSYGGAAAALLAVVRGEAWRWAWTPAFLGSLAYLSVVGSVISFGAFYAVVRRLGPARAGYIGVMSPVVALGVSSALEGYTWTAATVGGVALALAGNVLAMWRPRTAPAAAAAGIAPVAARSQPSESSTSTGA